MSQGEGYVVEPLLHCLGSSSSSSSLEFRLTFFLNLLIVNLSLLTFILWVTDLLLSGICLLLSRIVFLRGLKRILVGLSSFFWGTISLVKFLIVGQRKLLGKMGILNLRECGMTWYLYGNGFVTLFPIFDILMWRSCRC